MYFTRMTLTYMDKARFGAQMMTCADGIWNANPPYGRISIPNAISTRHVNSVSNVPGKSSLFVTDITTRVNAVIQELNKLLKVMFQLVQVRSGREFEYHGFKHSFKN